MISKRWKTLDDTLKKKYEAVAAKGRKEYNEKVDAWTEQRKELGLSTRKNRKKNRRAKNKKLQFQATMTTQDSSYDALEDLEPLPMDPLASWAEEQWSSQATDPNGTCTIAEKSTTNVANMASNSVMDLHPGMTAMSAMDQNRQGLRSLQNFHPHHEDTIQFMLPGHQELPMGKPTMTSVQNSFAWQSQDVVDNTQAYNDMNPSAIFPVFSGVPIGNSNNDTGFARNSCGPLAWQGNVRPNNGLVPAFHPMQQTINNNNNGNSMMPMTANPHHLGFEFLQDNYIPNNLL